MKLKNIAAILIALILSAGGCVSAGKALASGKGNLKYAETDSGVIITSDAAMMSVEFMSPSVIKVSWHNRNAAQDKNSLSMEAERPKISVSEYADGLEISSYLLKARIDMESGAITYLDSNGSMLLAEKARFVEQKIPGDEASYSVKQEFIFRPWEALYGMGRSFYGLLNLNGAEEFPVQASGGHPLLVSTSGYGILWAAAGPLNFSAKAGDSYISADRVSGIDYFFLYGGSINQAVGLCAKITGTKENAQSAPAGCAGWDMLRWYMSDALSLSMSGEPADPGTEGNDISVNYPGGMLDPSYRELYTRWNQLLAFSPAAYADGILPADIKDDRNRAALAKASGLRKMLEPYAQTAQWSATRGGAPLIRPPAADFSGDDRALKDEEEYMLGSSILVCPVTTELYNFSMSRAEFIRPDWFMLPDGSGRGLKYETGSGGAGGILSGHCWEMPSGEKGSEISMSGKLTAPESGKYEIWAASDGPIKVWLDGKPAIDEGKNTSINRFSARVKLKAGAVLAVKAEYKYAKTGKAIFAMQWVKPKDMEKAQAAFKVYMPTGRNWYDFWTGEKIAGGKTLGIRPALDVIPLYIPEGSIIPAEGKQAGKEAVLELRVYMGKDARFTIYEGGDSSGKYSEIPVTWKEKAKVLIIGKRDGEFEGIKANRLISIYYADKKHGKGMEPGIPDKQVVYKGEEIVVEKE